MPVAKKRLRLLPGLVALSALVLACLPNSPSSAATTCASASQSATSAALSLGDPGLAQRAGQMCNAPCESINNFYVNWSGYLKSASLEAKILDAYKTCLAAQSNNNGGGSNGGGSNGGGGTITSTTIKILSAPVVSGKTKVGQTLKTSSGKYTTGATVWETEWYACTKAFTKPQTLIVKASIESIDLPAAACASNGTMVGSSLKLTSKHKGKYILVCKWLESSQAWGGYCTKTTAKVVG